MIYVSVTKVAGRPSVVVEDGTVKKAFPLNFGGCRDAGRYIHGVGYTSWANSSSVDFPCETLPGFRGDVRKLLDEGFREAYEEARTPRKSVIRKMLAFCSGPSFTNRLTPAELQAFEKIKSGESKVEDDDD